MSYSWNLPVIDFSDWLLWVSNMHLRLLLVFSRLATTFLLSADWYVTVWLCHSLSSSHWLMKAIWVASQFGNCAWSCYRHPCSDFCMDISFFFFFWHKFLIHLGMYPGSQLLNCIVGICIVLQKKKKTAKLSSRVILPFCLSASNKWEFPLDPLLSEWWALHCQWMLAQVPWVDY